MAGTISVTAALQARNQDENWDSGKVGQAQLSFVQNNPGGGVPGTITVPVAGVDVDLSELGVQGWARLQNLDGTNFVQHGPKSGGTFYPYGKMEPGEPAEFRLDPGATVHLKADTADCLVQVLVMED